MASCNTTDWDILAQLISVRLRNPLNQAFRYVTVLAMQDSYLPCCEGRWHPLLQLTLDEVQHAIQQGVNDRYQIHHDGQNEELCCLGEETAAIHQSQAFEYSCRVSLPVNILHQGDSYRETYTLSMFYAERL